jgi:hypothetical protein
MVPRSCRAQRRGGRMRCRLPSEVASVKGSLGGNVRRVAAVPAASSWAGTFLCTRGHRVGEEMPRSAGALASKLRVGQQAGG